MCTIQIHILNSSNYLFHVLFVCLIGWLLACCFSQNYNEKKRNSITSRTKHWKFSLQLHVNIKYSNSLFQYFVKSDSLRLGSNTVDYLYNGHHNDQYYVSASKNQRKLSGPGCLKVRQRYPCT